MWMRIILNCAFFCIFVESGSNPVRFSHGRTSPSTSPDPLIHRIRIAESNTIRSSSSPRSFKLQGQRSSGFVPGTPAPAFKVPTLDGDLIYPGPIINRTTPIVFHSYNRSSSFLRCLWNCSGSVEDFVKTSPSDVHYVFMSSSPDGEAGDDVRWMKKRLRKAIDENDLQWTQLANRLHFVNISTWSLRDSGVWIADLLRAWTCQDHNCGLDQVVIGTLDRKGQALVLPRLDARYDWLPSPDSTFGNKTLVGKFVGDGCTVDAGVKGFVAFVTEKNCDYFVKIQSMSKSGALGVLVVQDLSSCPPDMNCQGEECNVPLNIPGSTIPNHPFLARKDNLTVQYRNTASENFFAAVDSTGNLAELGWLLHPSLVYLPWQAQWFDYRQALRKRLSEPAFTVNVFNNSVMHGDSGVSVNASLPSFDEYDRLELDFALSCPGERDEDCPHWDRTIQLFVCCDRSSALCGAELGRWISPFRRRIGRWLTSVDPLIPLFESRQCAFTVTGALSNEPWMPSLSLRFFPASGNPGATRPSAVRRWINGTFTFDRNYNRNFKEITLNYDDLKWRNVKIFSVITGHGSDENGCGEFCVTSHHFVVNRVHLYNTTFTNAGTPFGCADRVPLGVEPNEHGTWLYGRNGWCDGQQVDPWVIDVTDDLSRTEVNVISYFGWFRGSDPNPKQNPGVITINAYIAVYG